MYPKVSSDPFHTCQYLQIVDVKTGRTCGVNEAGEIWVRGPQASHGYLNLPDQTKAMFMDDGWVRTGTDAYTNAYFI